MRVWQTGPNTSLPRFPSMEPSLCGSRRFREPRAHDHAIDGLLTELLTELLTDTLTLTLIRKHKLTPADCERPSQRHFPAPTDIA